MTSSKANEYNGVDDVTGQTRRIFGRSNFDTSECNLWPIGKQETFGHVVVAAVFFCLFAVVLV